MRPAGGCGGQGTTSPSAGRAGVETVTSASAFDRSNRPSGSAGFLIRRGIASAPDWNGAGTRVSGVVGNQTLDGIFSVGANLELPLGALAGGAEPLWRPGDAGGPASRLEPADWFAAVPVDYNPVTGGSENPGAPEEPEPNDVESAAPPTPPSWWGATWSNGSGAGGSCRFPRSVASWDVASLRDVCVIDLGPSPAFPFAWTAGVPAGFTPFTDHDSFLRELLPVWTSKIDSMGWDETWENAGAALATSVVDWALGTGFDSHPHRWGATGLYWEGSEGFLWRAFRYAVATLYAYAFVVDEVPVFADAVNLPKRGIRDRFDLGLYQVRLLRLCDYSQDVISVSQTGFVSAARTWLPIPGRNPNTAFAAFTPGPLASYYNDGVQVTAALADYYFWWSLRLHDYVLSESLSDAAKEQYSTVSRLCARAAMAEIVDLAALILHEMSHTGMWPLTWWECAVAPRNVVKQECGHFNLGWYFNHRMAAELGLPLATLGDMGPAGAIGGRLGAAAGRLVNRFNFGSSEPWQSSYSITVTDCAGSSMLAIHDDFFSEQHPVTVFWSYPSPCAAGAATGAVSVAP